MGGPSAGVLLRDVPDDGAVSALWTWLGTHAGFYNDTAANSDLTLGWRYFLNWPAVLGVEPPGVSCLGGLRMHLVVPEKESSGAFYCSPADWIRFSEALGWMPACELDVSIFCGRPRDHKLLGWLSAELATRFEGVVDLGGRIPVPDRVNWAQHGLTGEVFDVSYDIDDSKSGQLHVVDAAFLRSWLRHPNFHMIK